MKASTKTEQPEWAMEIAKQVAEGGFENHAAELISQSPAIKELMEAAENLIATQGSPRFRERAEARLQSAFQPFKDSTGGG